MRPFLNHLTHCADVQDTQGAFYWMGAGLNNDPVANVSAEEDPVANVSAEGDPYLALKMVKFMSSFNQLHRAATFYTGQVIRRVSGGDITPRNSVEVLFSLTLLVFGMLFYKWKFFGICVSF